MVLEPLIANITIEDDDRKMIFIAIISTIETSLFNTYEYKLSIRVISNQQSLLKPAAK